MKEELLIIAILPVILLGIYIYKKDRHKEPTYLLVKLFFAGIVSCFLVLALTDILVILLPFLKNDVQTMNFIEFCIYVFISIAFLEELCKWLMTYYIGYLDKEFDEVYDIVVYAVFVALGFAAFENILYVFGIGSIQVGIMRGLLAIPGHVCYGIAMGYYLSLARYHEKYGSPKKAKINKIKSIVMPTIYHGIYDYCCFTASGMILVVFVAFIIFLYSISLKKVKIAAQEATNLGTTKNRFCPRCGRQVTGNYCPNCGLKQE